MGVDHGAEVVPRRPSNARIGRLGVKKQACMYGFRVTCNLHIQKHRVQHILCGTVLPLLDKVWSKQGFLHGNLKQKHPTFVKTASISIIGVSTHTTKTHLPVKHKNETYSVVMKKEYNRRVTFRIQYPDYQITQIMSMESGFGETHTTNIRYSMLLYVKIALK